jgi:hypothetical protein
MIATYSMHGCKWIFALARHLQPLDEPLEPPPRCRKRTHHSPASRGTAAASAPGVRGLHGGLAIGGRHDVGRLRGGRRGLARAAGRGQRVRGRRQRAAQRLVAARQQAPLHLRRARSTSGTRGRASARHAACARPARCAPRQPARPPLTFPLPTPSSRRHNHNTRHPNHAPPTCTLCALPEPPAISAGTAPGDRRPGRGGRPPPRRRCRPRAGSVGARPAAPAAPPPVEAAGA